MPMVGIVEVGSDSLSSKPSDPTKLLYAREQIGHVIRPSNRVQAFALTMRALSHPGFLWLRVLTHWGFTGMLWSPILVSPQR